MPAGITTVSFVSLETDCHADACQSGVVRIQPRRSHMVLFSDSQKTMVSLFQSKTDEGNSNAPWRCFFIQD